MYEETFPQTYNRCPIDYSGRVEFHQLGMDPVSNIVPLSAACWDYSSIIIYIIYLFIIREPIPVNDGSASINAKERKARRGKKRNRGTEGEICDPNLGN